MRQYRGVTTGHGQVVTVEDGDQSRGLDPRFDLHTHTADGFAWGDPSPGAAQLALALAADATGDGPRARLVAGDLAFRLTAALPADGWVLSEREVIETVRDVERERDARRGAAASPSPDEWVFEREALETDRDLEREQAPRYAAPAAPRLPLTDRLDRHLAALAKYPAADATDREAVMRERGWMEALRHLDGRGGLSQAGRVEAGQLVAASEDWLREQADDPAVGWSR